MRSILDELFYGNICPDTDCRIREEETKQLINYVVDHHEKLQATLTDEQKEILERFDDCNAELSNINEKAIFSYAFRLGAKIMLEVLIGAKTENY